MVFMLPMTATGTALIVLFVANRALLAEKGLTGAAYLSLAFLGLFVLATLVQFAGSEFRDPAVKLAKKFALYLLFVLIFIPLYVGALFAGIPLEHFLSRYAGGVSSTLGGVFYAGVLIFSAAAIWDANRRVCS